MPWKRNGDAWELPGWRCWNALERQGSVRDAQYQAIMEKLDKLVAWQEAQREKPVRRWENLADKAVWAVCAAVIAYMLAGLGL